MPAGSWFSLVGAPAQEAAANTFVDTANIRGQWLSSPDYRCDGNSHLGGGCPEPGAPGLCTRARPHPGWWIARKFGVSSRPPTKSATVRRPTSAGDPARKGRIPAGAAHHIANARGGGGFRPLKAAKFVFGAPATEGICSTGSNRLKLPARRGQAAENLPPRRLPRVGLVFFCLENGHSRMMCEGDGMTPRQVATPGFLWR